MAVLKRYDPVLEEWVVVAAGAQGATGPQGPQGDPGVVAATAPVTYDSGTQTVGIDESGIAITIQQVSGVTFGTASPTGGVDGDIFLQYTP